MPTVLHGVDVGTPEKAIAWIETGDFNLVQARYQQFLKEAGRAPTLPGLRERLTQAYEARMLKGE